MLAEQIKKHVHRGQPTKFDANIHIDLLIDVLCKGEDIDSFCMQAFVSKMTFHRWIKTHPLFNYAYQIAINAAEKWWKDYALNALQNNETFNYQFFLLNLRNRFNYGKTKLPKPKDKTAKARIESIWNRLEKGLLSTQEANQLSHLIMSEIKIDEIEVIKKLKRLKIKMPKLSLAQKD